jgi:hypothetical protein
MMQTLEITFIALELLAVLIWLLRREAWRGWLKTLALGVAGLGIAQIVVESTRWQMFPAYAAATLLLALAFFERLPSKRAALLIGLATAVLLIVSLVLGSVLPIFTLPTPDGPHAIGTATKVWFRPVATSDGAPLWTSSRKIIVQLWYPAEIHRHVELAPYRDKEEGRLLTRYLSLVRTHARIGVPVANAPRTYPVLLFSPAYNSGRTPYTFLYEMLASHGFIVAAMEHPLDAPDNHFDLANDATVYEMGVLAHRRGEDALFVLDQLTKLDQSDPEGLMTGRFDLSRVGILGHSFGGATAAEACWMDSRFKAGIDMDGDLYGEVADVSAPQPFFFMNSDSPDTLSSRLSAADARTRFAAQMEALDSKRKADWLLRRGGYDLTIVGSLHMDYSDRPMFSPLKRLSGRGDLDAQHERQIINAYVLAFFAKYLNGRAEPVLDNSVNSDAAVRFKAYSPSAAQWRFTQPIH